MPQMRSVFLEFDPALNKVAQSLTGDSGKQVFSVDTDIDLARGVDHFFEWLENHFKGKKTDQTLVYSLLFSQRINPAYTLDPLPEEEDE